MIKSRMILAMLAMSAVGLTACESHEGSRAVAGLCPDFKAATAPVAGAAPADAATPVDNCVKRWAYTLAGTHDDAGTVADAVVAACGTQLSAWNQTGIGEDPEAAEAISVTTGQPTNPLAEHFSFAQSHALLYVLQARAGKCSAPAVKDGVPVGV